MLLWRKCSWYKRIYSTETKVKQDLTTLAPKLFLGVNEDFNPYEKSLVTFRGINIPATNLSDYCSATFITTRRWRKIIEKKMILLHQFLQLVPHNNWSAYAGSKAYSCWKVHIKPCWKNLELQRSCQSYNSASGAIGIICDSVNFWRRRLDNFNAVSTLFNRFLFGFNKQWRTNSCKVRILEMDFWVRAGSTFLWQFI